jgi:hypothetical protein
MRSTRKGFFSVTTMWWGLFSHSLAYFARPLLRVLCQGYLGRGEAGHALFLHCTGKPHHIVMCRLKFLVGEGRIVRFGDRARERKKMKRGTAHVAYHGTSLSSLVNFVILQSPPPPFPPFKCLNMTKVERNGGRGTKMFKNKTSRQTKKKTSIVDPGVNNKKKEA